MLTIKKTRADHVIDYAAEELKKYLRMMMPECGEITIEYKPEAKEGFRLGLLEDFGLPFEGEDAVLDDVIHVDTTAEGGILAGDGAKDIAVVITHCDTPLAVSKLDSIKQFGPQENQFFDGTSIQARYLYDLFVPEKRLASIGAIVEG